MKKSKRGRKPGITKVTTSFTIDTTVFHDFDAFCKAKHLNKSAVVSAMIDDWMKPQQLAVESPQEKLS